MKSFLAAIILIGAASNALASGLKQLQPGETLSLQAIAAEGADVVSCGSSLPPCEVDVYQNDNFYVKVSGTVMGVWDVSVLSNHNRTEALNLVKELQNQKVCQGIQIKSTKDPL